MNTQIIFATSVARPSLRGMDARRDAAIDLAPTAVARVRDFAAAIGDAAIVGGTPATLSEASL